ncbi:putative Zn-binding protein involved in type VI secretion [Robbsia andropogonis]|uniref:PAAR domain-containing protein n=1 Tax=Robbsia andropogonis TaxID=28092 RepID=UPI003D1F787B
MARRAIICKGDSTTHGGVVLEGSTSGTIHGRPIAGVGHLVSCPRCKGVFPIQSDTLGRRYPHHFLGIDTAVEGMRTACGAELIASQHDMVIDDVGTGTPDHSVGAVGVTSDATTLCLECLKAAAESGATTIARS